MAPVPTFEASVTRKTLVFPLLTSWWLSAVRDAALSHNRLSWLNTKVYMSSQCHVTFEPVNFVSGAATVAA